MDINNDLKLFKSRFKEIRNTFHELGKGRFGVVYLVQDLESQQHYAAKFQKTRKRSYKERAEEEISILKSLSHENIIKYVDCYADMTSIVILMEYLDGGELFVKISDEDYALTEADCVHFVSQICHGVQYMHHNNVVHLDLKPENIVCCSQNKIKIIDFGAAKRLKPGQMERVMCGTPEFLAPEVVNYEDISTMTDMWAIGVVCYILLSGFSPFLGDMDSDTYSNITSCCYDFNVPEFDNISDDGKNFVSSLLIKDKELRLSAAECLEHPWLTFHQRKGPEIGAGKQVIKTDNLRQYLAKRRWLKCGQAIRAVNRLSGILEIKKSSEDFDCNGNTFKRKESKPSNLLEQRLIEEFGGHQRVKWKLDDFKEQ